MAAFFAAILVFAVWLLLPLKYFDAFPPLAQIALAVFCLVLGAVVFSVVSGTGATGFLVFVCILLFAGVADAFNLQHKKAKGSAKSGNSSGKINESHSRNLRAIKGVLPQLKSQWVGRYMLSPNAEARCSRVEEFRLEKGPDGAYRLEVVLSLICRDRLFASMQSDVFLEQIFQARKKSYAILKVNDRNNAGDYGAVEILRLVEKSLWSNGFTICDDYSIEHKLCKIMFMNYEEISWSSQSLEKIKRAAAPILQLYEASLNNDLLSANKETLRKSIQIMRREAKNLEGYTKECAVAMKKVYEFLAVPFSLKQYESLDIAPFETYQRQREMRDRNEEVIAIKNEYDKLRGV